jgi:hypothetical protein
MRLNKLNLSACGCATAFALREKVHISAAIGLIIHTNFVPAEMWSLL